MSVKPALSDEEVLEILRLHDRGASLAQIAVQFDRHSATIRQIVLGESYRHITFRLHTPGQLCSCRGCVRRHRQDKNLEIADRAQCLVACMTCGRQVGRSVMAVKRARGQVLCDHCDGRRK